MKKAICKIILYILLLAVVVLLIAIFRPRSYGVPPLQKRTTTQYWHLPTGSRIAYTLIAAKGNKRNTPVIYLHGGPGGYITDRIISILSPLSASGFDLYFYDQVGSGESIRLDDISQYTVDRHMNDLKEIIRKTGAQKVILIGQSWGAILALLFAAENSRSIEKIIFTSPGPVFPINETLRNIIPPDSLHLKAPIFTNRQGNLEANNLRSKTIAFFAHTFKKKIATDTEADDFASYLNATVNRSTVCDTSKVVKAEAGSGYYASVITFNSLFEITNPRPKLKNTKIPVLVIKGQCDNQEWGFTQEYLTLFHNSRLACIPGAGHDITIEQPELYFTAISHFLDK